MHSTSVLLYYNSNYLQDRSPPPTGTSKAAGAGLPGSTGASCSAGNTSGSGSSLEEQQSSPTETTNSSTSFSPSGLHKRGGFDVASLLGGRTGKSASAETPSPTAKDEPQQQQTDLAAVAAAANQALFAQAAGLNQLRFGFNPAAFWQFGFPGWQGAGVPIPGSEPVHSRPPTEPASNGSPPANNRTPSPNSAARWQETFAKIMARSYQMKPAPGQAKHHQLLMSQADDDAAVTRTDQTSPQINI